MTEYGRYIFAVSAGLRADDVVDQTGLDGRPLQLVEYRGLQAVVCDVPLDEFGEDAVHRNLEQLPWVEVVARTHDAVVRAMAARATVVPLRLVTICLDDRSVASRLRDWEDPLKAALKRVDGCWEWSAKAYVSSASEAAEDADEKPLSGTAYLQRKREQGRLRRQAEETIAATAQAVHLALAGVGKASRRLAPQDPRLTGRSDRMVLNGAYLVPDNGEAAFRDLVQELQQRHPLVTLETTGPWAPYSFAVLDVDTGADER